MYPTEAISPKLYGLPKIHKKNNPLRPTVSSRGSVTYGVVKELARILKPQTGNTIHHVNNSMEFADDIKKIKLEEGECIISYDVSALFTLIPVQSTIEVTKKKLEQDTELHQRTPMSIHNILELLGVLSTWHLLPVPRSVLWANPGGSYGVSCEPCSGKFIHGFFEEWALISAVNPPRWWKRYVDDISVILKQSHREEFLQHISSVDPSIQFTTEDAKQDGSMPFLDTLVTSQEDGTLTTRVYRKPTHSDLYLQWDSHHNLAFKYSVINTLTQGQSSMIQLYTAKRRIRTPICSPAIM